MNFSSVLKITPVSTPRAFQELLGGQLGEVHSRLEALRKKSSSEEIHQLRVLTRRTRATCQTLQSIQANSALKSLHRALRSLTRKLGPIRALDVSYEDLTSRSIQRVIKGQAPYGFLIKPLNRQRRMLRKKMKGQLKKRKRLAAILSVSLEDYWGPIDAKQFTSGFLEHGEQSFRSVERAWKKFQKSKEIKDLHQIRIQLKKLRYLQEISFQCFGETTEDSIQKFKQLQDRLGHIHDLQSLVLHLRQKEIRKKVQKKNKAKQGLYEDLLKNLKASIESEVLNFHNEGASVLRPLLKGVSR